ncbi:MAG: AAA family ATPase [Leptolyngbyaceae cyanobacterium]
MVEALKLDYANACLWQGAVAIPLTPKAMAVVEYLVTHAGEIATKDALLNAVWANENVSEYAVTSIIRDLRRALGDNTKNPRYIQTVHRRGYRWIGHITTANPPANNNSCLVPASSTAVDLPSARIIIGKNKTQHFTGRVQELATLRHHLQLAATGKRQMVFLTGEAGIGKTTLLEKFSDQISNQITGVENSSIALGQCIEKYGIGEAYRPVLEALNRFCYSSQGEKFIGTLERYAPSWLVQMPPLLTPAQLLRLQQQGTAPPERWLRELAEALEVITREHLLVLIFEDLHWADPSTIELLDLLARRKEFARLLVLASYRPAEVNSANHPLRHAKQELQLHNLCQEIALGYLNQPEIETYLVQRFAKQFAAAPSGTSQLSPDRLAPPTTATEIAGNDLISTVAAKIYQRTEGSPLFMVNVVESLIDKDNNSVGQDYLSPPKLTLNIIPDNLKQLIDRQFDALDAEKQKILEAACVEGAEFLSVTVAASLKLESEQVELCIDDLVQLNHLITIDDVEILPDGTLSTRYRFIHALYQEGLYQRLSPNRRVRLHRAIATQLETIYGDQAHQIASQLALHFEQGMHHTKAIGYRQQAGKNALQRSAHAAAIEHFHQALTQLPKVAKLAEREALELSIQTLLGSALMTLKGQAAPAVGKAYERARQLCPANGPEQFDVTLGLWRHTFITGNLERSLALSEECFTLAQLSQHPARLGSARYALAGTLMYRGELEQALNHAEAGLADYRRLHNSQDAALRHSQDPSATLIAYRAWILFFMGYWEQAVQAMNSLFELAIVRSHPQTTVTSLTYSGILYLYLHEFELAQQQLEQAIHLTQTWQIPQFATIARFFLACTKQSALLKGRSSAIKPSPQPLAMPDRSAPESHRLVDMQTTLDKRRAMGADLHASGYLNRLAEGYLGVNNVEASLATLSQSKAITKQNNERIFEADTDRIMGSLFLLPGKSQNQQKAESSLQSALAVAQHQKSATFELRAATQLAQLWQEQGRSSEAETLLRPIYDRFTEGFDFFDLQQAQRLLGTLRQTG